MKDEHKKRHRGLIRGRMLLDLKYDPERAAGGLSKTETEEYRGRDNEGEGNSNMKQNILNAALEYLADALPEDQETMKDEYLLPLLLYLADEAEDEEIPPDVFGSWWRDYGKGEEFWKVYRKFREDKAYDPDEIRAEMRKMREALTAAKNVENKEKENEL